MYLVTKTKMIFNLLFVILIVNICICYSQKLSSEKRCQVQGKVLDIKNAIIPEIYVTFKNLQTKKTVITDEFGDYSIPISKGVYTITLKTYLNPELYKRAKLNISCDKSLVINFYPLPRRISYGDESPEHQFQSFSKPWSPDEKLDLVISYLSKAKKNYIVTYTDTMLTYNNLTISANKIIQNFKNKTIIAKGDIWLEDGKKRTNYEKLTLKFSKDGIKIEGEEKLSSER